MHNSIKTTGIQFNINSLPKTLIIGRHNEGFLRVDFSLIQAASNKSPNRLDSCALSGP